MRDSFIMYRSFYEAIKELPQEYHTELLLGIMDYSLNGETPQFTNTIASAFFKLIKPLIDSSTSKYEMAIENGKKGGRPKTQNNPSLTQNNPSLTQMKPKPNLNDNDNDNDNVNENVNENVNCNANANLNFNAASKNENASIASQFSDFMSEITFEKAEVGESPPFFDRESLSIDGESLPKDRETSFNRQTQTGFDGGTVGLIGHEVSAPKSEPKAVFEKASGHSDFLSPHKAQAPPIIDEWEKIRLHWNSKKGVTTCDFLWYNVPINRQEQVRGVVSTYKAEKINRAIDEHFADKKARTEGWLAKSLWYFLQYQAENYVEV